jgi:iron complex outermembrane receptor protein
MVTAPGGYSVYGNYGRTFQTPLRDGLYGAQSGASYSRNDGWEAGVKAAPARWANGQVAYWRQTASDEVRLKISPAADVENVGETLRHGIDVQAEATPFEALTLWGAYTLQRAIIVDPVANLPALANQSLDHVPGFLLKAGIDSRPIKSLTASAWIYAQGAYSITDTTNLAIVPPDSRFGGYTLVNADLSYAWRRFTFSGHVRNLLDTRWNSTVWNDGTVTLYNPGDGRAFFASVETAFW